MDTVYLEWPCVDDYDDAGQPKPLNNISMPTRVARQVKVGRATEVVDDFVTLKIVPSVDEDLPARIIPDSRIVAATSPMIVESLLSQGFVLCDPPANPRASRARRQASRTEE